MRDTGAIFPHGNINDAILSEREKQNALLEEGIMGIFSLISKLS